MDDVNDADRFIHHRNKTIENAVRWLPFVGTAEVATSYGKKCEPIEALCEKDYHQEPIDRPNA